MQCALVGIHYWQRCKDRSAAAAALPQGIDKRPDLHPAYVIKAIVRSHPTYLVWLREGGDGGVLTVLAAPPSALHLLEVHEGTC